MPTPHNFANDQIFIDKLNLKCNCGADAFGRTKPQPVQISVSLGTNIARAAAADRVDLSIDYSTLSKQLTTMENENFKSVVDLVKRVTTIALRKDGAEKVSIKVSLDKGMLRGKIRWERMALPIDKFKGDWKCCVEGVEVPIILGIKENIHERTQPQLVIIDLEWHGQNGDCAALEIFPTRELVNAVIKDVSNKSYESVESLSTFIAEAALHSAFQYVTVTVRKPSALPFAAAAGVKITRSRHARDTQGGTDVYIALGTNLGDRVAILESALKRLGEKDIHVREVSGLYESEPMYVQDQPQFLNAVCKARTTVSPRDLLLRLKEVEIELGRLPTIRNGPRTIDLDILLYGREIVCDDDLVIPHISMLERGFVLQPLADLAPYLLHPVTSASILSHLKALPAPLQHSYLPLRTASLTFDVHNRKSTLIMAILNLTPDSFSDGGLHSLDPEKIVDTVRHMIDNGAQLIDIGGQSTRPNAAEVSTEEELHRVINAIKALRAAGITVPISIDTYRSAVAAAAINAGADIINDVSAGGLDSDMFCVAARLKVPIILMHMRGTPSTMNSLAKYEDVVDTVGRELSSRVQKALEQGVQRWQIILDPGLGFAKSGWQNVEIIRGLGELRGRDGLYGYPWVVGPSRKRFIANITGEVEARERSWGTAGAVAGCVQGGADIVRVHDVEEMSKVVKMCDAIWRGSHVVAAKPSE